MAENLTQYKSYTELLALLKQHGLPKDAVAVISNKLALVVEEALRAGQQGPSQANGQKQPAAVRDISTAEAVLQGIPLIIPRGKFDVAFFADSMQVSNKQTSAAIPYSSIKHVLVIDAIPKQPNTTNVVLVMKSGQPVQQGKNQLDLVVMQTKDQPELQLPAPPACQHLGDQLAGAAAVVLSQLLACYIEDIQEDTFLTADSSVFSSSAGDLMIAANFGATSGWLVPLSAGLCYVGKPGRFMPVSSISRVLFHRAGGGSSTFDITIKLAPAAAGAGAGAAKPLELGQIDAAELGKLQGYFLDQRIKIGTDDDEDDEAAAAGDAEQHVAAAAAAGAPGAAFVEDDEDEEDDDYDPEAAEPSSKKQRTAGSDDAHEEDDDDDEDEAEAADESDDDSSDVSLIDEDAMDEDDEDDE